MSLEGFNYDKDRENTTVFSEVRQYLASEGYRIEDEDMRPWGTYYRFADNQLPKFLAEFFDGVALPTSAVKGSMSPKIMVVEPGKRLSWQDHELRGEFWKVVHGPVGAFLSPTDEQPAEYTTYQDNDVIDITHGTRHRLVGIDSYGVVAEIWIHINPNQPSTEADVRRINDDFARA